MTAWRLAALAFGLLALGLYLVSDRDGVGPASLLPHVARVTVSGLITDDRKMNELIEKIGKSDQVKAVILDINSPGGTTTGGEALYDAVRRLAEKKPVVAVCGTLATSAAYIAALATDRLDRDRVATQLRQTVLLLVGKLVGEIGISPDLLAGRIESATELLADSAEAALLRLHPDDVALIEGTLPKSIFAAGDPNVARGSFVLESASTIVEDGPAMWLDQLASAIDRVAVPAKAA